MIPISFDFNAKLWLYPGKVSWVFITLPQDVADGIRFFSGGGSDTQVKKRRGFGAVKVSVQIGQTRWATSVFPDKASGSYFLPIKAAVRRAEDLTPDACADVSLSLLDGL